ncbi:MAG: helix-hairpin-helix domain-containing protein [Clostridia bacterium]
MQNINLKTKIGIIAMAAIAIVTIGLYIIKQTNEDEYIYYENIEAENQETIFEEGIDYEKYQEMITVHVTGEVNYPGVVVLKVGDRVVDAIEAAGGEKEEADLNKLNLAYILNDGEKIYVPNKNENSENEEYITSGIGEVTSNSGATRKININSATIEELTELPGIGEATASKIISYRQENGKFKDIEELKNVPGIGNSKFETIKELISVK